MFDRLIIKQASYTHLDQIQCCTYAYELCHIVFSKHTSQGNIYKQRMHFELHYPKSLSNI